MKQVVLMTLALVFMVLAVGQVGPFLHEESFSQAVAAPPLSLDGYMDEKLPEAKSETSKLKVDNQACYVCHANYREESLATRHGREGIGCIDCHGESVDHRNDEDNITPPDKMYPLREIDRKCHECHDTHDASARRVILRWRTRCPEKTNTRDIVCTDCHFRHRLEARQVQWDKKTGKLLGKKDETKPAEESAKEAK